jgi:hypothetical protein
VHGDRSDPRGVSQLASGPTGRSDADDVESVLRICARQSGEQPRLSCTRQRLDEGEPLAVASQGLRDRDLVGIQ